MKTMRVLAVFFAGALMLAHTGWAQEKAKRVEELKPLTPLKVQVVFSEIDGDHEESIREAADLPIAVDFAEHHLDFKRREGLQLFHPLGFLLCPARVGQH